LTVETAQRFLLKQRRRGRTSPGRILFPFLAAAAGLLISGMVMAQQCPVLEPLTIKDLQGGFAGETGTVWTIAPDCSFTVARQIGLRVLEPHKQGQLTAEQQARLKEMLDRVTVASLPVQLGSEPQVNARRITLSYGGKETVLNLAPCGGDQGARRGAAADNPAAVLLDLVDTVKGMTAG
jgi:hypothetical protein